MRKKIIRAFLGVYLAICVTYGVVRGVTVPAAAEDIEPPPTPAIYEEAAYTGRGRGRHGSHGGTSAEPADSQEETSAQTPKPEAEVEVEPAAESEEEDEKTLSEDDASEPAAIPTLEEYLKNLHCGGCGRNCFLLSPRCMRGARKESQAESAYYEQYGESYGAGGEL